MGETTVPTTNFFKTPAGWPPVQLGVENVRFGRVTFANVSASPAALFKIPEGAEITRWEVNVRTAFDGTGNNDLDLGVTGTANRFADALSMAAAAQLNAGFDPDELFTPLAAEVEVLAIYNGTTPTEGEADVAVWFIVR